MSMRRREFLAAGVALNLGAAAALLAEQGGVILGQISITFEWSDWRNGWFWWVQSVYVRPEFRRRGVYRALYKYLQTLATQDPSICGFRLYVERDNVRAQATYRTAGMDETRYIVPVDERRYCICDHCREAQLGELLHTPGVDAHLLALLLDLDVERVAVRPCLIAAVVVIHEEVR